jgi:hypothetical protein
MTRDELVRRMSAIKRHLAERVTLVRVVVDEHGRPTGKRIYSGSFVRPPGWEPPHDKRSEK